MDPRINTKPDVVAASHVVLKGGCFPYRIVLRDLGEKFVTHRETLEGDSDTSDDTGTGVRLKHRSFEQGSYFEFNHGTVTWLGTREEAFEKAKKNFNERVEKL